MKYIVTGTIVSGNIDGGEPVDVNWYSGESLAVAVAAAAQAATHYDDGDGVPESVRTHTLGVAITFEADCPWRDMTRTERPFWAKAACSGREVDTEVGTLCGVHHAAMRLLGDGIPGDAVSGVGTPDMYMDMDTHLAEQHAVESERGASSSTEPMCAEGGGHINDDNPGRPICQTCDDDPNVAALYPRSASTVYRVDIESAATSLLSVEGENPEYDRAIVELSRDLGVEVTPNTVSGNPDRRLRHPFIGAGDTCQQPTEEDDRGPDGVCGWYRADHVDGGASTSTEHAPDTEHGNDLCKPSMGCTVCNSIRFPKEN